MIRFFIIQNHQGKTRLSRWYASYTRDEKSQVELELYRVILQRRSDWTQFIDYHNYRVIYRQYAGLLFILCVDVNDNELGMYQFIHLFVEVLDSHFGSVCELDFVFHFEQVYRILDLMVLGGEPAETCLARVINKLKMYPTLS